MSSAVSTSVRQPARAATAAFAGTTIEWYDFFIYSTASALVFPQLFFPNSDPNVSLLISLATRLSGDSFPIWGWRIPFLFSLVLLVVGMAIRLGVNESPEFTAASESKKLARFPIAEAFRQTAWPILFTMLAFTIGTAGFYFTNTFLIAYTTRTLDLDRAVILDCLAMVAVVQFLGQLAAAKIAERIGDSRFLLVASALAMLAPYPMFLLVQLKTTTGIVAGVSIATLCASGFYAVIAGYASKVFPVEVRYSSISASYQLSGAIFGGFTPIIGVALSASYPGQWVPLAILYSILAGVSFLGVSLLAMAGFATKTKTDGVAVVNAAPAYAAVAQ